VCIYTVKYNAYGVDYLKTFSPVAKMNTVRVILFLAANCSWNLQQFDLKNALIHGELEGNIYMELPLDMVNKVLSVSTPFVS